MKGVYKEQAAQLRSEAAGLRHQAKSELWAQWLRDSMIERAKRLEAEAETFREKARRA